MSAREGAFEDLYRREYDPMCRVAFLLLGSVEAAAEAAHDGSVGRALSQLREVVER